MILMAGSGLAQLIPFLASLILARLYTSEEFGVFTLYISIVAFLSVVATMRYEVAIMLPKKNVDAFHLVVLSLFVSLLVSLSILLLTLIFPSQIAKILPTDKIEPWLILIAFGIFFTAAIQVFSVWFNRQKKYKELSTNMVAQSATTASVNIGNGYIGNTSGGLILGSLAGQLLSFGLFAIRIVRQSPKLIRNVSWQRMQSLAHRYAEYPKFNFPHRMVDMISITGLPILIAFLFSEAVLGWYGFMLRILKAPLGLLAASLGQVYFQQISENVSAKNSIQQLFSKTVIRVFLLILPFFIPLFIWGDAIFAFAFGEEWRQAGVYAQYLAPWLLASSITSPVSQTPVTLNRVKTNMWLGITNNLLLVAIFVFAATVFHQIETAFLLIGILMPIYYFALLYWYYHLVKNYELSIR